jgi:hypothetical protein
VETPRAEVWCTGPEVAVHYNHNGLERIIRPCQPAAPLANGMLPTLIKNISADSAETKSLCQVRRPPFPRRLHGRVFLVFSDGTSFEFYSFGQSINWAHGLERRGLDEVLKYIRAGQDDDTSAVFK